MTCSPARLAANRANALKSTGPVTDGGKAVSRANALKHGLTGAGVALPTEDVAAVAHRFEELAGEFRPSSPMARLLVGRVAMLSVRLERAVRQETAALAVRVGNAEGDFDAARVAEAERLLHWIGSDPATNARLLRRTPEGVDCLIAEWQVLKADLDYPGDTRWDYSHYQKADDMNGRRSDRIALSPYQALTFAMKGNFDHLGPDEGAGLDDLRRRRWARRRLGEVIDADVARLRAHRETLGVEAIAAERAGAADRALFDPSKEVTLARKYEAAAERGVYRALKELRVIEPTPPGSAPAEELGSFLPAEIELEQDVEPPIIPTVVPTSPELDQTTSPARSNLTPPRTVDEIHHGSGRDGGDDVMHQESTAHGPGQTEGLVDFIHPTGSSAHGGFESSDGIISTDSGR